MSFIGQVSDWNEAEIVSIELICLALKYDYPSTRKDQAQEQNSVSSVARSSIYSQVTVCNLF